MTQSIESWGCAYKQPQPEDQVSGLAVGEEGCALTEKGIHLHQIKPWGTQPRGQGLTD